MKKQAIVCISALLFSASAAADWGDIQLGVIAGVAAQKVKATGINKSDNDAALGVRMAVSPIPNLGVEVGYERFGKLIYRTGQGSSSVKTVIESSAITFGGKFSGAFDKNIDAYARAGVAVWDGKVSNNGTRVSDPDGSDPYFGVGVIFNTQSNTYIGAEYTYFMLDDSDADLDIHRFAITAGLKF